MVTGLEDDQISRNELYRDFQLWQQIVGTHRSEIRSKKWFTRQVNARAEAGHFLVKDSGGGMGFKGWVGIRLVEPEDAE